MPESIPPVYDLLGNPLEVGSVLAHAGRYADRAKLTIAVITSIAWKEDELFDRKVGKWRTAQIPTLHVRAFEDPWGSAEPRFYVTKIREIGRCVKLHPEHCDENVARLLREAGLAG